MNRPLNILPIILLILIPLQVRKGVEYSGERLHRGKADRVLVTQPGTPVEDLQNVGAFNIDPYGPEPTNEYAARPRTTLNAQGFRTVPPSSVGGSKAHKSLKRKNKPSQGLHMDFSSIPGFTMLTINFDNDIYGNTDYYYTNGINFRLIHPALSRFPTAPLLLPDLHGSVSYYGVELVQNIYTPIDPDKYEIQEGDRPFAGYLYAGFFRTQLQPQSRIRLTSSLNLGLIGPGALGGVVQSSIHDIEPVGWQNQVSNDIILNYNIVGEKVLMEGRHVQWAGLSEARLGTLYTDVRLGTLIRVGNQLYHYDWFDPTEQRTKGFNWFVEFETAGRLVGYDATLQGGLNNPTSPYIISKDDVSRTVLHGSMAIGTSYGFFSILLKQHFLSPEFRNGKAHTWGRISLNFRL